MEFVCEFEKNVELHKKNCDKIGQMQGGIFKVKKNMQNSEKRGQKGRKRPFFICRFAFLTCFFGLFLAVLDVLFDYVFNSVTVKCGKYV